MKFAFTEQHQNRLVRICAKLVRRRQTMRRRSATTAAAVAPAAPARAINLSAPPPRPLIEGDRCFEPERGEACAAITGRGRPGGAEGGQAVEATIAPQPLLPQQPQRSPAVPDAVASGPGGHLVARIPASELTVVPDVSSTAARAAASADTSLAGPLIGDRTGRFSRQASRRRPGGANAPCSRCQTSSPKAEPAR